MEQSQNNLAAEPSIGFDYRSQIDAIRALLARQRQADTQLGGAFQEAEEYARNLTGDACGFALDRWTDFVLDALYQDAAHSMASVGMLAPIAESAFKDAFRKSAKPYLCPKMRRVD